MSRRGRGRPAGQTKLFEKFALIDRRICQIIDETMTQHGLSVETVLPKAVRGYERLRILERGKDRGTNRKRIWRAWEARQRERAVEIPRKREIDNSALVRILAGIGH